MAIQSNEHKFEPVPLPMPSRLNRELWPTLTVLEVAKCLIGMHLRLGEVEIRITEVEAYGDATDSASHARFQKTSRNEPMFGPPGRVYVYLCYGIHMMLNVVAEAEGHAAAVLIRSAEVVAGLKTVEKRRSQKANKKLIAGPGKIGQALAIDTTWNNHDLLAPGQLQLIEGKRPERLLVGPRVGIDYAEDKDVLRPWRIADAESSAVTSPSTLTVCDPE